MDLGKFFGSLIGTADPVAAPASIIQGAKGIIGLFKLDPTVKAQLDAQLTAENLDLEKQDMAGQIALMQGQIDTNKVEAASPNWFIAGWRPAVGWVCVAGLSYDLVLAPFIQFALSIFHWAPKGIPLPTLNSEEITALLLPLLGLGALRTTEKLQNAEGNR